MPNFKAKVLKPLNLPFVCDELEFSWVAENESVSLIYTKFKDENFFLQIKKNQNEFIIKADKHAKPSKISYIQKALQIFKENFCEEIINEAFALKNNALLEKTPLIACDFDELLSKLSGEIYVEIGFGSGRHLLYQAQNNPKVLMLGVEIYTPSLTQVAKLAKAKNLENILLIQSDARLLLSVLQTNSVKKIFLHFPVPWDKKPHRRVVSTAFARECARVLSKDGSFELRSDSFEYFDFSFKTFLEFKTPKFLIKKNENLEVSSKYEDRWKRQDKDIYDLIVSDFSVDERLECMEFEPFGLSFSKDDLKLIWQNFKNCTIKKEEFFVHFESIYKQNENLLLKVAFGAFNRPEHCYLRLGLEVGFVFKEPFKIRENLLAFKELKKNLKFHLKILEN